MEDALKLSTKLIELTERYTPGTLAYFKNLYLVEREKNARLKRELAHFKREDRLRCLIKK